MCPLLVRAIVLCVTRSSKETEEMNHYIDPYMIRDRNEQMRKEVDSLRLQERLRKERTLRRSRLATSVEWDGAVKRVGWVAAMVLTFVAALAALALAAPSSQAAGKPDLVMKSAELTSQNYVFSGEESTYSFMDTTKNRGSATAPSSKTALELRDSLLSVDPGIPAARRNIPRLKPDHSDKGSGSDTWAPTKDAIGSYYAVVCADFGNAIKESREHNNCKDTGERLSIIPRQWTGTVSGSAKVVDGVTETWSAPQMTLKFDSYSAPYLDYTAYGNVSYSISGTDDQGCTWSGSGTATIANGGALHVHVYFADYDAGAVITEPLYTITRSCPNGSEGEIEGPWNSTWFYTGAPSPEISDPNNVASLAGNYTTSDGSVNWQWNLAAN
jgi:hypothetical protein